MGWANSGGGSSGGGGSGILATDPNTFTAPQTFKYDATHNGKIIIDTTDQAAHNGYWVFLLNDMYVSGAGGSNPGQPRTAMSAGGRIYTFTDIVISPMVIGDVADNTFWALGPFETTAQVDTISGCLSGMLSIMSDVNGPAMQCTAAILESEASLFAGGTRTPGSPNATLTFMIDQDGAIFMGSILSPRNTGTPGFSMLRPEKNDLWPMLWRSADFTPTTGGLLKVVGDVSVAALGAPTGGAISNQGTAGATTYTYKVTAISGSGAESTASSNITTATGNATLTGGNFNRISWTRIRGAAAYKIYRTVGGATQGQIGSIAGNVQTVQFDDTGLAGGGETAPTSDATGNLTCGGKVISARIPFQAALQGVIHTAGTEATMMVSNGVTMTKAAPLMGFIMPRSGSVVGVHFRVTNAVAHTTNGSPTIQVYAGTSALSGCIATISTPFSAINQARTGTVSFNRGVHTFGALGSLELEFGAGGTIGTYNVMGWVEVVYDL